VAKFGSIIFNRYIKTKQKSPENAQENVRQRCMFKGPLRTKSKLKNPNSWHSTRWLQSC